MQVIRTTIEIDGKKVEFKASAAVPRIYRIKFGKDLFMDLQKIAKSMKEKGKKKDRESSEIPISDLTMFENIAYTMAKHADPENVPDDVMEWLERFNTFSIYEVLPEILKLWNLNEETMSEAKKNSDQVAGS
nr:MAG TPA: tail assembly chaperone protein [Caudoviricetes sp.]